MVTHSQNAPSNSANAGSVLLYLNCNNSLAAAGSPGYSAASPEGRAQAAQNAAAGAEQEAQELAWRGTGEGQVWCATTETQLPEVAPLAGCH